MKQKRIVNITSEEGKALWEEYQSIKDLKYLTNGVPTWGILVAPYDTLAEMLNKGVTQSTVYFYGKNNYSATTNVKVSPTFNSVNAQLGTSGNPGFSRTEVGYDLTKWNSRISDFEDIVVTSEDTYTAYKDTLSKLSGVTLFDPDTNLYYNISGKVGSVTYIDDPYENYIAITDINKQWSSKFQTLCSELNLNASSDGITKNFIIRYKRYPITVSKTGNPAAIFVNEDNLNNSLLFGSDYITEMYVGNQTIYGENFSVTFPDSVLSTETYYESRLKDSDGQPLTNPLNMGANIGDWFETKDSTFTKLTADVSSEKIWVGNSTDFQTAVGTNSRVVRIFILNPITRGVQYMLDLSLTGDYTLKKDNIFQSQYYLSNATFLWRLYNNQVQLLNQTTTTYEYIDNATSRQHTLIEYDFKNKRWSFNIPAGKSEPSTTFLVSSDYSKCVLSVHYVLNAVANHLGLDYTGLDLLI